jgi:hypothetical protein
MGFIEGLQRDLGSSWRVLAGRPSWTVAAKASIDPPPSATVGLPPASEAALPALLAVV